MLPTYLIDTIILLSAAVIFVPLMQYLKLGSILGFLVAGAVIGPWVLGLITEVDEIRHFAELGVAFLLFIIGVELKPKRLLLMRKWVFGLGSTQVLLSGMVLMGAAMMMGLSLRQSVIVGFGLALSSTAFVLQILTEQGLINTLPGRRSFAILLLQDLAVVPLLALTPLLIQTDISLGVDIAISFGEAALIFVLILAGGRFLLSPILRLIARSGNTDIFAATALLLVLGVAGLITTAGFSMAMGAFVAGLLIADSEYRHQVLADIQPFRAFLLGLFFMSVGMSMDFMVLIENVRFIVLALVGLLLIKGVTIWISALFFGIKPRDATAAALMLSQSGEFAFVIFGVALTIGLLDKALFDQLILIVALSMAVTPLLAVMARRFISNGEAVAEVDKAEHASELEPQVIIAGFGRVGRRVARMLKSDNVPYIAIDTNAELVHQYRSEGFSVFFGNAGNLGVLISLGVKQSRLVVVTIDQRTVSRQLVSELRAMSPDLHIVARGRDSQHCIQLCQAGADETVSESFEASLQLGAEVLQRLGRSTEEIFQVTQKTREQDSIDTVLEENSTASSN